MNHKKNRQNNPKIKYSLALNIIILLFLSLFTLQCSDNTIKEKAHSENNKTMDNTNEIELYIHERSNSLIIKDNYPWWAFWESNKKKYVGIIVATIEESGNHIYSFGKKNLQSQEPIKKNDYLEIGSISKTFTALLLADMVTKSEININKEFFYYLDELKSPSKKKPKITLYHLVTHTSGLPSPQKLDNYIPNDNNPYKDLTWDIIFDWMSRFKFPEDAGTNFEYSNIGMGVLGYIMEKKTGVSYEKLIQNRIGNPLGIHNLYLNLPKKEYKKMITGYFKGGEKKSQNWDFGALEGAGAIRTSMEAMIRYGMAQAGILHSSIDDSIKESHKILSNPKNRKFMQVAYGWIYLKHQKVYFHNGTTGGYQSVMVVDPKKHKAVVILSNTTNVGIFGPVDKLDIFALNIMDKLRE